MNNFVSSKRFGLFGVEFMDDNRPRKKKLSAVVIKNIFESKKVPEPLTLSKDR